MYVKCSCRLVACFILLPLQLSKDQAYLDPLQPAVMVHNHVRAFAGWPGTRLVCLLCHPHEPGTGQVMELKVFRTRVVPAQAGPQPPMGPQAGVLAHSQQLAPVVLAGGSMLLHCGDGNWVEILEGRWSGNGGSPASLEGGRSLMSRVLTGRASKHCMFAAPRGAKHLLAP